MTNLSSPPRHIAIVGLEASGKDTYANYLETKGYLHVAAGDFLRAQARRQGYKDPIDRATLSKVGDELKLKYGPSPIVTSTLESYRVDQQKYPAGIVISGLRRTGEIAELKKQLDAVVLWIDCDDEIRFHRQTVRARDDHAASLAEFIKKSHQEYRGDNSSDGKGVNLQAVEAMADMRIPNNGTEAEFIAATDALIGLQ